MNEQCKNCPFIKESLNKKQDNGWFEAYDPCYTHKDLKEAYETRNYDKIVYKILKRAGL